jgi:hypothetical protein
MTIPRSYRKSPEIIQSYDYKDISRGIGIEVLFPAGTNLISSSTYLGSKIQLKGTYTFISNPFVLPRTINGIVYVSIPLGISIPAGSGTNGSSTISTVTLSKIDEDGNVTTLATHNSLVGLSISEVATGGFKETSGVAILNNIENQIIKKGERISLHIVHGGTYGYMFANPRGTSILSATNNDHTFTDTQMTLLVPFKLDI